MNLLNLQEFISNLVQRQLVNRTYFLATVFTGLLFLGNASAHGGEPTDGLSNLQITLISLGLSVVSFFLIPRLWELESNTKRKIILTAVVYTGAVHVMLGLQDIIFMIGGIGIIV
ncbi:MAG: hypothetical protein CM15mP9_2150 [Methanobacteriota archaeon]|nr:MAG: hypothetical protein CM15mP9_2150 [Euryarchaeota archaeon]